MVVPLLIIINEDNMKVHSKSRVDDNIARYYEKIKFPRHECYKSLFRAIIFAYTPVECENVNELC